MKKIVILELTLSKTLENLELPWPNVLSPQHQSIIVKSLRETSVISLWFGIWKAHTLRNLPPVLTSFYYMHTWQSIESDDCILHTTFINRLKLPFSYIFSIASNDIKTGNYIGWKKHQGGTLLWTTLEGILPGDFNHNPAVNLHNVNTWVPIDEL